MLNYKDPVKDFRLFGLIWLATIFIFSVFLGLLSNNQVDFSAHNNFSSFLLTIFLMDILIGIIAFPFIILNGFRCLRSISKEKLGNKISRWIKSVPLTTMIVLAIVLLTGTVLAKNGLITLNLSGNNETISTTLAPTPEPTLIIPSADPNPTTRPTPRPTQKPVYIDPDPIINCNFTYLPSKQMKQSQCNISFECQIGSQWYIYTSRDKCTNDQNTANKQNNNYPPCTVYYPALGYSKTYNYTSPSDCSYWQQRAKTTTQPLSLPEIKAAPLPTAEPYQYSQEYLNAMEKYNQEISKPFQPTQFVAPTPRCYATWDEYFNAHPNYAPQNIKGTSVTPPCD